MEPDYKKQQKQRRPMKDMDEFEGDDDDDMEVEGIDLNKPVANKGQREKMDDDEEGDEPLEVNFLFYDPNENQFSSIKSLVNGLLDGFSFKSSELADMICNQVVVGTMIGVEGDEEIKKEQSILGFATILNLNFYKDKPVMKEIVNYVVNKSEAHNEGHEAFLNILKTETDHIGLLVNERMINLAPQLVPTLHAQLCEDVNWVREQNNEDSPVFNLKYLLCLSKCYKEPRQSTKRVNTGFDNFIYQKFEDYVFLQRAIHKFVFTAKASKNVAGLSSLETPVEEQVCERLIYLISFEDYVAAVQTLPSQLE